MSTCSTDGGRSRSGSPVGGGAGPGPGAAGRGRRGGRDGPEQVHVVAPATPQHWDPLTDDLWDYEGDQLVLTRPGTNPNDGVRRPFEYAIVSKGPELTDVAIDAEVRLDESVSGEQPRRDRRLELPGPEALLLRALLAGQHDLPPQRDLRRRQRRPPPHRRPVERLGRRPARRHRRRLARRAGRVRRRQRRDRGVRRRGGRAPDDRHRHHLHRRTGRLRLVRQLRPGPPRPRGRAPRAP